MTTRELTVRGALVLESPVFADDRGLFREWFRRGELLGATGGFIAAQANVSVSRRNTVRGLHYSMAPEGQAKVVTCAAGELTDVLVDVRLGSPTFGVVDSVDLNADSGLSVFIPAGVAHGFCVTSESAALVYLLSSPYNGPVELEVNPFDDELSVPWPLAGDAVLSDKDAAAPTLAERRQASQLPRFV